MAVGEEGLQRREGGKKEVMGRKGNRRTEGQGERREKDMTGRKEKKGFW